MFFLSTAVDQVEFMGELLALDRMVNRTWVTPSEGNMQKTFPAAPLWCCRNCFFAVKLPPSTS
jgi:hypothetical protein